MAATTLLLLLSACGPTVSKNVPPPRQSQQELMSAAALSCKDDVSERVAQVAREKFPDSTKTWYSDIQFSRQHYLRDNRWALFEVNRDRRMTFDEYHAWIWASLLIAAAPGSCIITREQYLDSIINKPTDSMNGWHTPSMALPEAAWRIYDTSGRGFIVKDDIKNADLASFHRADIFNRGYLTPDQTF
ncbi:MAG: hypothetical protein JO111_13965 [Caulobacteraceae bacterium]|nr:hypothetical protein [Caulobacteraceae bacterium]